MSEAGLKDPMLPSNRSTTFYAGHAEQKHNAAQAEYDRSAALVRHRSPEILLGSFLIAQRVRPNATQWLPHRSFLATGSNISDRQWEHRKRACAQAARASELRGTNQQSLT
jgi:hypothetical protein